MNNQFEPGKTVPLPPQQKISLDITRDAVKCDCGSTRFVRAEIVLKCKTAIIGEPAKFIPAPNMANWACLLCNNPILQESKSLKELEETSETSN